ncbi:sugar transporter SWEET1-like [Ornithodoros turicata]|uniref:sugar transporter SWEET1-like n=1 Tax=Ornithodoros turicata TaxID=34597 RepID=UPI003138AC83
MNTAEWVGYLATVVTIASYTNGIPLCRQIYKQRSSRDVAYLPLVCGCFSTFVWLQYGLVKPDHNVVVVNALGIVLQVFYVLFYYFFTESQRMSQATGMIFGLVLFMAFVAVYVHSSAFSAEHTAAVLGKVGSLSSLFFYASPLLSIAEVLKSGSSDILPSSIITWSFVVSALWAVYGLLLKDANLYVANGIGVCITGFELFVCAWYPARKKSE